MKILVLSPYLPIEHSGHAGAQLVYRVLDLLASRHRVCLACFIDRSEIADLPLIRELTAGVHTVSCKRNARTIRGRLGSMVANAVPLAQALLGRELFFVAKYDRRPMHALVQRLMQEFVPDLVLIEYNVMHHYAKHCGRTPVILREHDVSTKLAASERQHGRGAWHRAWAGCQYRVAGRTEPGILRAFDGVITVTDEDRLYAERWPDLPPVRAIPPLIRCRRGSWTAKAGRLCFVGSFNREPNRQAVEILVTHIMPEVLASCPDATLHIAGGGMPRDLGRLCRDAPGVTYAGFVEDLDSFVGESELLIAPLFVGAGLKMKVTDALACGTAVLTTPVGAEGISLTPEEGLWVEDDVAGLCSTAIRLLGNPESLQQAGAVGRARVECLFGPQGVLPMFEELFRKVLQSGTE